MLWLKFLLGGLIIAFCTLLGWFASGKYRQRKSYFTQLASLNEKYLAELKYTRKPMKQFLSELPLTGDFQKSSEEFLSGKTISLNFPYLKEDEKRMITEYFSMLGKGDSNSQNSYFSSKSNEITSKKQEAEKNSKEYGELYLKLGLLAGLAFVILIV